MAMIHASSLAVGWLVSNEGCDVLLILGLLVIWVLGALVVGAELLLLVAAVGTRVVFPKTGLLVGITATGPCEGAAAVDGVAVGRRLTGLTGTPLGLPLGTVGSKVATGPTGPEVVFVLGSLVTPVGGTAVPLLVTWSVGLAVSGAGLGLPLLLPPVGDAVSGNCTKLGLTVLPPVVGLTVAMGLPVKSAEGMLVAPAPMEGLSEVPLMGPEVAKAGIPVGLSVVVSVIVGPLVVKGLEAVGLVVVCSVGDAVIVPGMEVGLPVLVAGAWLPQLQLTWKSNHP